MTSTQVGRRPVARGTDRFDHELRAIDHDYRVLGPWQVTDPNGNRSQIQHA